MLELLTHFGQWLLERFRDMGYPGIVILMAMESSVLPVPSEAVMPPVGYLAAKGEMNLVIVIACGVLGSVLGALANYGLSLWLGRAVIRRLGRYVLISEKSLDRAERFFDRHGEISTLLGRMLPVVRHLISIPAGIARMPLRRFVLFTGLGAFLWCTILATIGYVLGQHEDDWNKVEVQQYLREVLLYLIPALIVTVIAYAWWQRRHARAKTP